MSLVKIPSSLIFLAFNWGGGNSILLSVTLIGNPSPDSYGHLLSVLSIFPVSVRFQTVARGGDTCPPATTSRPQPLAQAAEASPTGSPLLGLPLKALEGLARRADHHQT